jgi:phosphate starvation-inducible protein PhoH
VAANRLRQKPLGGLLVTFLGEEKVDRLARFIDGAIEIAPLASG